jgi:hypothetical protein
MAVTVNGVVHGTHIDLDAEPQVPDGRPSSCASSANR